MVDAITVVKLEAASGVEFSLFPFLPVHSLHIFSLHFSVSPFNPLEI